MKEYDFYTGQPVENIMTLSDPNDNSGSYALDTSYMYNNQNNNMAMQNYMNQVVSTSQQPYFQQPQIFNNLQPQQQGWNGYGYNNYGYNNQNMFGQYMNMPSNNYGYNYGYQGYQGAPMNTPYMPGYAGNPAGQMMMQNTSLTAPVGQYNPYTQQAMYFASSAPSVPQDRVITVDGYTPSGSTYMLKADAEDVCDQMQVDMMFEQFAAAEKRESRVQGYFNNNYGAYTYYNNYYGMPYVNPYFDQGIYNSYMDKLRQMAEEAVERRSRFNKNLSRLCHNYLDDGVTDEQIDQLYDGYSYTIPGIKIQEYNRNDRLYNVVPFDNSWMYQQHEAEVSAYYKAMSPSHDMNGWLNDCGFIIMMDKLEEQYHKNKDGKRRYDVDTFHKYLMKYAVEHDLQRQQRVLLAKQNKVLQEVKNGDLSGLPQGWNETMSFLFGDNAVKEMEERAKFLAANGIHVPGPPDSLGTPVPVDESVFSNEEEAEFEERRSRFIDSIYNTESFSDRMYREGIQAMNNDYTRQ